MKFFGFAEAAAKSVKEIFKPDQLSPEQRKFYDANKLESDKPTTILQTIAKKLKAAKGTLKTAKGTLKTAEKNLKTANEGLEKAQKELEDAKSSSEEALKKRKRHPKGSK